MNKATLVEAVAVSLEQSKAAAGRAVDAVLEALARGLADDGQIALTGFGSFRVRHRAGRVGRNPRTGEPIQIAPAATVAFKAGDPLKARLKGR